MKVTTDDILTCVTDNFGYVYELENKNGYLYIYLIKNTYDWTDYIVFNEEKQYIRLYKLGQCSNEIIVSKNEKDTEQYYKRIIINHLHEITIGVIGYNNHKNKIYYSALTKGDYGKLMSDNSKWYQLKDYLENEIIKLNSIASKEINSQTEAYRLGVIAMCHGALGKINSLNNSEKPSKMEVYSSHEGIVNHDIFNYGDIFYLKNRGEYYMLVSGDRYHLQSLDGNGITFLYISWAGIISAIKQGIEEGNITHYPVGQFKLKIEKAHI